MPEILNFANPHASYLAHSGEINLAIRRVLDSPKYILGDEVEKFEGEFAEYLGVKYSVGVNSGTDALVLAMRALNLAPGDEVIVPSHTATATVSAVIVAGGIPVFADVDQVTFTLDPDSVKQAITRRTKIIIAVHLYGQACDMESIGAIAQTHSLEIIEDCAQAHGAKINERKVGSFGVLSCFSFFPTKNLGGVGDGGAIATNSLELALKIRSLRQYGWDENRISSSASGVSRLDEIQAAILRVKLQNLDISNKKRVEIASCYDSNLSELALQTPVITSNSSHVFHLYVIKIENRESVIEYLKEKGINPGIHYPVPNHFHPAFKKFTRKEVSLGNTENLSSKILSLPMYPEMTSDQISKVISALSAAVKVCL
jgi:dTDP-4-amino-4,6-dideoxygalactose transaminase